MAMLWSGKLTARGMCPAAYDSAGNTSSIVTDGSFNRRRNSSREISGISDMVVGVSSSLCTS